MPEQLLSLLQNIDTLIPLIFLAYIVLSALIGLWRGWRKALIRLATLAVAAVGAYPITTLLIDKFGSTFEPMITQGLLQSVQGLEAIQGEIEMLTHYLGDIASAILAVSTYAIVFIVLSIVLSIAYFILKLIFVRKSHKEGLFRLAGIAVGAVCGMMCCVCVLMPFSGLLTDAATLVESISTEEKASLSEMNPSVGEIIGTVKEVSTYKDCLPLKLVSSLGGDKIYRSLSSFKTPSGKDTSLEHELEALVHLIPGGLEVVEQFSQEPAEETGMIPFDLQETKELLVPHLYRSDYLCGILAELFHTAGNKWNNNETFLNMNLREMAAQNNAFSVVVDHFLTTLMATTEENLAQSVSTICDDMTLLSHTANYVAMFSESEKTKDDLQSQMDKVVLSVTENNIDFFNEMLTSEVMREGKLSEENADVLSGIMGDIFGEIASLETEEERLAESQAINSLFTYAGQVGDENKQIDESTLVDTVLDSKSVSGVLQETVESGEYTVVELSYEKQKMLAELLTEKGSEATEEEQATLDAIAALFGLNT